MESRLKGSTSSVHDCARCCRAENSIELKAVDMEMYREAGCM